MENKLPYYLSISFDPVVFYQSVEERVLQEGFEKIRSDQTEEERFEYFSVVSSGKLSATIVPAVDNRGLVERCSVSFPAGISTADLEASFRFLKNLEEFLPEIRDQEIQNQHFLRQLEQQHHQGEVLSINAGFISGDTLISADFEEFRKNTLNITKRTLILQPYKL